MSGATIRWIHSWPDSSVPEFRVGRVGTDFVAQWIGFAELRADRTGHRSELTFHRSPTDPLAAAKFNHGHVQGLLRHLQGRMTLHGSGVLLGGRAILLTGKTGSGKSSLGAALCLRNGAQFMADDMAAIESGPSNFLLDRLEDHHWLLEDAARVLGFSSSQTAGKKSVVPVQLTHALAPLHCIVQLEFDDSLEMPMLERVAGQATFELINRAAVRFVLDEPTTTLRDFEQVTALAAEVPIFVLKRPRGVHHLNRDIEMILHASSPGLITQPNRVTT